MDLYILVLKEQHNKLRELRLLNMNPAHLYFIIINEKDGVCKNDRNKYLIWANRIFCLTEQ